MKDWAELLRQAYEHGKNSPDPSTKNGSLLFDEKCGDVRVIGFNHFANGVLETEERWQRPLKYNYIVHAEVDVIAIAANVGVMTNGLTMVCPWAACSRCAGPMIQAGIKKLVTHKQAHDCSHGDWANEIILAFGMFKEARLEVVMYDGLVGVSGVLQNGQLHDR